MLARNASIKSYCIFYFIFDAKSHTGALDEDFIGRAIAYQSQRFCIIAKQKCKGLKVNRKASEEKD